MIGDNNLFKNVRFINIIKMILFVCSIIILIVVSIFLFIKGKNYVEFKQLFYNEMGKLDYKVCLKPNSYFSDGCLDSGKQYIANIIDYIDTDFQYTFNSSDVVNYDYKYYITAKLSASEKGGNGNILYGTEEVIVPEKSGVFNNNYLTLNEKFVIDYSKYNDLMTSFRKDYTLLLDSKLIITMHIDLKGKHDKIEEKISSSQDIVLSVPLSEQTINITMDYQSINNSEILEAEMINEKVTNILYIMSGVCLVAAIGIVIKFILFINKNFRENKTLFAKKLDKILKEYNHVIVESKAIPSIDSFKIFELNSFDEILDARETILKPIIHLRIDSNKSWFILTHGEELYRFVLNGVDLERLERTKRRKDISKVSVPPAIVSVKENKNIVGEVTDLKESQVVEEKKYDFSEVDDYIEDYSEKTFVYRTVSVNEDTYTDLSVDKSIEEKRNMLEDLSKTSSCSTILVDLSDVASENQRLKKVNK